MSTKIHASGFAAVPYTLLDQAPDSFVVHVYAVLHRHGWASKQGAWLSIETIRRQTGISAASIRRSLRWLKDSGWVDAIPRLGDTTIYYVRVDGPMPATLYENMTPHENVTPHENLRGPLMKTEGDPLQKRHTNKNPLTRTQEQEPNKTREAKPKGKKRDALASIRLPSDAVPLELLECADLLTEFWSVKKGTRSTPVFNRVCNKLMAWTASERQEALERAISSGWGDVFKPKPEAPQRGSWAPPETRHPASRVFTAANGFEDQPTTNPLLADLL
jgi:hypothetical protein